MAKVIPRLGLVSTDMKKIRVVDLEKLRRVLENLELMEPIYKYFLSNSIVSARVSMYPHPDGVTIKGVDERQWLYVRLRSADGMEYDAALWKIINIATTHSRAFHEIAKCIEVG